MMKAGDPGVDEMEREEVLAYLPDLKGKKVLLLGAGTSRRYTGAIAQLAGQLTAAYHTQVSLDASQADDHLPPDDVTSLCSDVTTLEFPPGSFDLVFADRLFAHLQDADLTRVLGLVLGWLRPGGHLFMLETCILRSDVPAASCPGAVRSPLRYLLALQATTSTQGALTPIKSKSCLAYIQHKGDPSHLAILAERVSKGEKDQHKQFMDIRYSSAWIFQLEWLVGHSWASTGGEATTREFCQGLGLVPGQRVLDVGCGSGGSATFMARYYGVHVHGVDISTNMICLALQRQTNLEETLRKRIQFEGRNILKADYPAGSYDVIYSRNSILHIHQKAELFRKLKVWLKPGGTLFITDYCIGTASPPQDLRDFVGKYHMRLVTLEEYGELLRSAGFTEVQVVDQGKHYHRIKEAELRGLLSTRLAFLQEHPQEDFDELVNATRKKIMWKEGNQITWGVFTARKGLEI